MRIRTAITTGVAALVGAGSLVLAVPALVPLPAGAEDAPASASGAGTDAHCAEGWPDDVQGRPRSLEAGAAAGVYVWHGANGWGAAVTHPGHHPVRFEVLVRAVDGRLVAVERRTEPRDDVDVRRDHTGARLQALNWGWIDGMGFRACARGLVITATIDGQPVTTDQVFLGADASHPTSTPVIIERERT